MEFKKGDEKGGFETKNKGQELATRVYSLF